MNRTSSARTGLRTTTVTFTTAPKSLCAIMNRPAPLAFHHRSIRKCCRLRFRSSFLAELNEKAHRDRRTYSKWMRNSSLFCRKSICASRVLDLKIVKPDGTAEWEKRRTRSAEFCSRLQRNYLYQLTRQIADLQVKGRSSDQALPLLTSAYQTLLQAFQAYHNHIPISLGDLVPDKLRMLVEYANELCDFYVELLREETDGLLKKDLLENIRNGCAMVLSRVNEMTIPLQETVSKRRSVSKSSLASRKKCTCKKALNDKLSMYSIPNACKKDLLLKKSTAEKLNGVTRCGPCVQSRYKTAGFKHRPPVNRSAPAKPKLFPKRTLEPIKETPVESPKNHDDIETMVKVHKDKEMTKMNQSIDTEWEQVVLQFRGLCESLTAKEKREVSQAQLEILLKNLMEMALSGKINNNTPNGINGSHINSCKDSGPTKSLPNLAVSKTQNGEIHIKNGYNLEGLKTSAENKQESTHSLQSQWKILEVSGAKNAQLICIRDEGSGIEVPKNPNPSLATLPPETTEHEPAPITKVLAERIENETVPLETNVKISHPPPPRKLTPLPKHKIKTILQGKLSHAKVMKMLPMYCKSTDQHPWEVVDNITHRLLEDILLVISKEIQVGDILQSLYNSEFL
ncbi:uncharacterized protein LOC116178119 isoform X2 [Photinus pyralis]|uniref:uncharacterized protein LOC116178119 isoform X2 n=1 Tax=Photinus pyralis TaxID=7054 RepID=UPI001267136D|nr:uncharacterized protein LOC116178119 isoform X2 [Photinus pyralis]